MIGNQADRRRSDPVQKGEGDRERERSVAQTENSVARTRRRDLAAASGFRARSSSLSLLSLLSLSLSVVLRVCESFLSLFLSLCVYVFQKGFEGKIKTEMLLRL